MKTNNRILILENHKGINHYATLDQIQAIWAAVSAKPNMPIMDLSKETGVNVTKVKFILTFLEQAGYIAHSFGKTGRQVNIPLVTGTMLYSVKWTAPQSKPITESLAEQPA
jgi:hypothetical protein